MTRQFPSAKYIVNGKEETVEIDQINRQNYQTKYKGHLYCPGEHCLARLKFVPRKNGATVLLQAVNISEHNDGCRFSREYKKYEESDLEGTRISEEHIANTIKYQLGKFFNPKKKNESTKKNTDKVNKRESEEPTIQGYPVENIDSTLKSRIICAIGTIHSIHINEKRGWLPKHAYINFNSEATRISILISAKHFEDESTEQAIAAIKSEFDRIRKDSKKETLCVCVGWVQVVQKGINILPVSMKSIEIAECL